MTPPLTVACPRPEDAPAVARVHLRAWLQTYPNAEAGIDEAWVREHLGSVATAEGVARWREVIEESEASPETLFCRVVLSDAEIVGFLCGKRADEVTLGPMYLLRPVQSLGVGGRLMADFLEWAGPSPIRLWVTSYNDAAIRFYARHGFRLTGEQQLWKGKLDNVRMLRQA